MKKYFVVSLSVLVVFLLSGVANAASTIGTNMSTTGTFTQTVGSATAARFQNAAGDVNVLVVDTTNTRIGVGAAPSTTFEVQGTASAAYFFTGNTIQVGGGIVASVAYNRFGSTATSRGLSASNDVLVNGKLEVDGNAFFDGTIGIGGATGTKFEVQGTASASYFFTTNTLQAGGTFAAASVAYSRFGIGTTGHSLAAADDILVSGLVEFDDNVFFDAKASMSGNFQTSGRFIASTAASHSFTGDLNISSNLVVGSATASSSGNTYVAEFVGPTTATVSVLFGGNTASSKGTCFQMKDTIGDWRYVRILAGGTSLTINGTKCH
ncbi:MAG: hypothetical protein AAB585_01425 [Patescibacteria group bacterium]